ncbi:polynucleotide phosphorylase [Anaeromicrobium sediminis]|uniref:polynucleotide phosphorylase n=1 Tax=Anaeromicrobium sediminis TaxID=1478221 RepID=UPI000BA41F98|nr:polynucleotide phosphorylase [Anaeromicrobium sediminis]
MNKEYLNSLSVLNYADLTEEQLSVIQNFEKEFNSKFKTENNATFFMIMQQ